MDEHYIEFTAVIGPIGEPYKLHTFDADGKVRRTVHGDLAERLANALWEVDHDADISAHITTATEIQTSAELGRLRAALRLIAIAPIHVPDVSEGCEGCARTARRALDGEDFSELADRLDGSAEVSDE